MDRAASVRGPSPGWVNVTHGVEMRSLVEGEGNALMLYRIAPGLQFRPHRHDFPEYGTIVLGRGRLLLADGGQDLLEGDSYFVPRGVDHGFESAEQSGPVVILHVSMGHGSVSRTSTFLRMVDHTRTIVRAAGEPRNELLPTGVGLEPMGPTP
jgi:quercetin dioxygenase-like cupin family protein